MRSGTSKTNNDVVIIPLTCFVDGRGSLTPIERKVLPFDMARVYFVHGVGEETTRGDHGHYRTNQVLIAVEGDVTINCYDGITWCKYTLNTSEKGLYVPAGIWATNHHSKGSVMCVLADRPYNIRDYIENRTIFKRWKRHQPFFGMFESFGEVEVDDTLENSEWLDYQLGELDYIGDEPDQELKSFLSDGMVVVDFGGSLGHSYLKIANSGQFDNLEYHIIETSIMVDAGHRLFPDYQRLFFHEQVPNLPLVDVVYSRTALQYVEDWRGALERLANLGAKYIVLSDTQVGNNQTFVGIQNWYGHFIPNWFFNIDELTDAVPGYDIFTVSKGMSVNMSNYPKEQRLTHACNLTFRRKES